MDVLIIDDFKKVITLEELEDVVGDLATDGLALLDELEEDAISEMTGYLDVRYDPALCFDPAENDHINLLKTKLIDIILNTAYSKISPNNIPDLRSKRYDSAINYLEKVADGFITPLFPTKEDDPNTPLRYGSAIDKQDNFY